MRSNTWRAIMLLTLTLVLVSSAMDAQAARRSSLAGNQFINDPDDMFAFPQLTMKYKNRLIVDMEPGDGEDGNASIVFGDNWVWNFNTGRSDYLSNTASWAWGGADRYGALPMNGFPGNNGSNGNDVAHGTPNPVDSKIPGDRIALKISLPAPMFKGTPKPIKGEPNMGPARKGKRPPFMAPKGTVNLAAGKTVKSSDPEPIIGELKFITNGEKDGGDGYFVELAPGKQWITIDLGQQSEVNAVVMWHYHQQARAYRDVVIQVSKDEDFIDVLTVFNNDHDNSSGQGKGTDKGYIEDYQGKLIACKGIRGRYVHLWSKENGSWKLRHQAS
jgi:hypothetical protein